MRQQFKNLDTWRGKLTATWICLAPPAAMVAVFVAGGVPSNSFVVDSHALGLPRQDSVFDDLVSDVPAQPGVDGGVGTEKRSSIDVPVTGATDNKQPVIPGVIGDTSGIPGTVLAAYQKAANDLALAQPNCHITWPLLAGIGKVESSHASGGRVDAAGNTRGKILGPVLDGGPGMAAISDTDQGKYDGNTRWDRAVGPMQFIPGSWNAFGADGNGDGVKDPHNVFDASRAAADYLCSNGSNLSTPTGLVQAVLRYNHSMDYVNTVLRWMQSYSKSTTTIPDTDGVIDPTIGDDGNVQRDSDPTHVPGDDDTTSHPATTKPATHATQQATKPATHPTGTPTVTPTVTPTKTLPTSTRPTTPTPPWTVSPTPRPTPTPTEQTPSTPPTTPTPPPTTETPTPTPTPTADTPTPTPLPPCDANAPTQAPTETPTCTPVSQPAGTTSEAPSNNSTPDETPTTP
ncbi:lytic murein transglycosylase [Kribbella qitaiheensis]|uniref:Lytic murein transglycosylase n=1 Tax=Kribbella qitaiheensis TaxID=1544730 RepID=A0A7G6WUA8_9ACTN|nr:lytic murein transglycosylase [Kribbella qitaiheensis]QNE17573.1 lytic murein transglycosylase [Kribbella qitaiheensis]